MLQHIITGAANDYAHAALMAIATIIAFMVLAAICHAIYRLIAAAVSEQIGTAHPGETERDEREAA